MKTRSVYLQPASKGAEPDTYKPMISPGGMRASAKVASVTLMKAFHSGRAGILGVGRRMLEMVDVRMRKTGGRY